MRCGLNKMPIGNLTDKEKRFWRIRAGLQEMFSISDEQDEKYPEIKSFLNLCANLALSFKEKGADSIMLENHRDALEAMGVRVLKPRKKP